MKRISNSHTQQEYYDFLIFEYYFFFFFFPFQPVKITTVKRIVEDSVKDKWKKTRPSSIKTKDYKIGFE